MNSPKLSQGIYYTLKSVFLHLDNLEKTFLSQFDLSTPRFYILKHVFENPGINYIDLSRLMLCTRGNTTRIVQGMLNDSLVRRVENPDDHRSYQLYLTDSGKEIYKEVNREFQKHIQGLLSKFTEDQLRTIADFSHNIEDILANAGQS